MWHGVRGSAYVWPGGLVIGWDGCVGLWCSVCWRYVFLLEKIIIKDIFLVFTFNLLQLILIV